MCPIIQRIVVLLLCSGMVRAQQSTYIIAPNRQLFHYHTDKAQERFWAIDGKADSVLFSGVDEAADAALTEAATTGIDNLQRQIETDPHLSNNQKLAYLRGLTDYINNFREIFKKRKVKLPVFTEAVYAWGAAFDADRNGNSLAPVINQSSPVVAALLMRDASFEANPGYAAAKDILIIKKIQQDPSQRMAALNDNPGATFADSLIAETALKDPAGLYTYAQATTTKLGMRINQHPDSAVQLICKLANDNSGQLYFPFYDMLYRGTITIPAIQQQLKTDLSYYRLLVKTEIDYAGRASRADTPLAWNKLRAMLHNKAWQPYVSTINALHEAPAATRFKILNELSAAELFFLPVTCETEIYTSSYLYVYKRIWQQMKGRSDSLLQMVNYDYYKKFIAMAANYNMLDDFLSRMPHEDATTLMTGFVNNLDKGSQYDLEDAVDVANSYASINNPALKKLMLGRIRENRVEAAAANNKRAQVIYRLEDLILSSSDSAGTGLSDSLGILPIYSVQNNFLQDAQGRIVLQMFFYGHNIGRGSYEVLKRIYTNKNWKRTDMPEWVQFTSVNSKVPFVILANRPGYEERNEDTKAQEHLNQWIRANNMFPSITVHRGHSYDLPETIRQLMPTSKVIVLGSCGSYHSLDNILELCPEAYLFATKQTGVGKVNVPLFNMLIDHLKDGEDIQWENFWRTLRTRIVNYRQGDFDDYIPPYKNLGAIFIKAYKKAAEN